MRLLRNLLYNFHWVLPAEVARSAQPYAGYWGRYLRSNGIRGLINLRGAHPTWGWWQEESRLCQELGIAHFNVSLNSRFLPSKEQLVDLIAAFDAIPRPFLIKCSGGMDRTSLASALYILHTKGWAAAEIAKRQFRIIPYLHLPKREQQWLRVFIDYARADAGGASLADWASNQYDQAHFKQYLTDRGMEQSFRGMSGISAVETALV